MSEGVSRMRRSASAPAEGLQSVHRRCAREVHRYALPRLPPPAEPPPPRKEEPAFAMAGGPSSGIIEID